MPPSLWNPTRTWSPVPADMAGSAGRGRAPVGLWKVQRGSDPPGSFRTCRNPDLRSNPLNPAFPFHPDRPGSPPASQNPEWSVSTGSAGFPSVTAGFHRSVLGRHGDRAGMRPESRGPSHLHLLSPAHIRDASSEGRRGKKTSPFPA